MHTLPSSTCYSMQEFTSFGFRVLGGPHMHPFFYVQILLVNYPWTRHSKPGRSELSRLNHMLNLELGRVCTDNNLTSTSTRNQEPGELGGTWKEYAPSLWGPPSALYASLSLCATTPSAPSTCVCISVHFFTFKYHYSIANQYFIFLAGF